MGGWGTSGGLVPLSFSYIAVHDLLILNLRAANHRTLQGLLFNTRARLRCSSSPVGTVSHWQALHSCALGCGGHYYMTGCPR